ncbi:hypothetical protein SAMN02745111_01379 [Eubacterium uniforme]|uniref:Uncharacterized protein n=1 Tax=Eubacterium uniforme TaxID=39495 RepID=A0A1T4VQ16_9FIRM|nr:hypothetical protein [Eubacterium uniforme]SKA67046.1 hypothetical protein SAMN02745111_01379 [Eubacterium uniforme]
MSIIKNENKEIYDGIKLNTESKERIIDELVEKIESNSNNISELDGLRRERMMNEKMKNDKMLGTIKTALVAFGSIAATLAIVVGVANYNNGSNKKTVGKNVATESVTAIETVTEKETEKETETVKDVESDLKLANAKEALDFKRTNKPNQNDNGEWDNEPYEYEYAKSDIDGDGEKDVIKISYETSKKYKGNVNGKVTLYVNDVEKKTYDLGLGQDPRNVKFIDMDDNKYFVYFDIGEETVLSAQRVVSLQDYEEVVSDACLPYMQRVEKVLVDNKDKKIIFEYYCQLNYIGAIECMLEINCVDDAFKINNKWVDVVTKWSDEDWREWLQENDGKYAVRKDAEFFDGESDDSNSVTIKKGEKLILKSVRWNDTLSVGKDKIMEDVNSFIDMYHFVTEEGKDVYFNPLKDGIEYYQTVEDSDEAIFENVHWAQ